MQFGVPEKIERAVLRASGVIDDEPKETKDTVDRSEFREDTPFAKTKSSIQETTIEDTIQWLHDQGYDFDGIYGLLMGEIESLAEGFERKKKREQQNSKGSGSKKNTSAHGNRGDRAAQLGWR